MAKKKVNKKADKKAKPAKPVKKAGKPAPSKSAKMVTGKAGKSAKKSVKPAPKASKSSAGKGNKSLKPTHTVTKKDNKKMKSVTKVVSKKKEEPRKAAKPAPKEIARAIKKPAVKPTGKPIDAVLKKGKEAKGAPVTGKKKGKKGEAAAGEEEDAEVKDDYEKTDEEDVAIEGNLDEAGMIDLEGASTPDIDEDEDEIPEKRGRGRRKKNEGKSSGGSMEAYIRNRPLQIDINKPLIKKGNTAAPKPFVNTEDKRTRYSDKELAEFKELILEKLKEAQMDYDLLKQTLSNEDNHGTDDTSPSFKLLEDGSDVMSKEETAQLASRQEKYIVNLKNALVRIENKAYGICRVTGKLIPKERLRSVPHATLGIDAKLSQS
jgi:RNA polymerase-binding transcription factor DksA